MKSLLRKDCEGCLACINACPHHCIYPVENKYGEWQAFVDKDKCSGCGICMQKCYLNNVHVFFNDIKRCYAVWSRNEGVARNSSSGGFLYELSRFFLQNGGRVCGVRWNESFRPVYKMTNEINDIVAFSGSKYVAPMINNIYRKVEQELANNNDILFIGLPCIVHALKTFLGKDNKHLLAVDLLCSGTPPFRYLKEYVDWLKRDNGINVFDDIRFRGKRDFSFSLLYKDIAIYCQDMKHDLYWKSFQNRTFLQEKCYHCRYHTVARIGDMTVGDFWGLGKTKKDYHFGVNLVLINTDKGLNYLNKTREALYIEERSLEEAVRGSYCLQKHSDRPVRSRIFHLLYRKNALLPLLKIINWPK